jgi:transposase
VIGKVDPVTGEALYKPEYISRMSDSGTPVKIRDKQRDGVFTVNDIKNSTIKDFGNYYFLEKIADAIGLKKILKDSMGKQWKKIWILAAYLTVIKSPLMYCQRWMQTTETLPAGDMSSQRISELLHEITEEDRSKFYTMWIKYRSEREYLALDITSISTWSHLIEDVQWGYNRDHDPLPPINLCMLMGEDSGLPVFQTVYSGSLKDVSTFKTTLKQATCYIQGKTPSLVLDKGFFSHKNVCLLLDNNPEYKFLMPLAFSAKIAKEQIADVKADIDNVKNLIVSGKDSLHAQTRKIDWEGKQLYAHIYFNARAAIKAKEDLYTFVTLLKEKAQKNPKDKNLQSDFDKYLIIRFSENKKSWTVNIRKDIIGKETETAGWLILISNHEQDAQKAIEIYRAKDVVEKGFMRIKNTNDLKRLRVDSQESMCNKLFIGFISLIVLSHMNKIMLQSGLYKKMTLKEMIFILKTLRIQYINGQPILFPLTKEQKSIFDAFSVSYPL